MITWRKLADNPGNCIEVRFLCTGIPEEALALQLDEEGGVRRGYTDLNIQLPDPAPTGAALDKLVMKHAPTPEKFAAYVRQGAGQ